MGNSRVLMGKGVPVSKRSTMGRYDCVKDDMWTWMDNHFIQRLGVDKVKNTFCF